MCRKIGTEKNCRSESLITKKIKPENCEITKPIFLTTTANLTQEKKHNGINKNKT